MPPNRAEGMERNVACAPITTVNQLLSTCMLIFHTSQTCITPCIAHLSSPLLTFSDVRLWGSEVGVVALLSAELFRLLQ